MRNFTYSCPLYVDVIIKTVIRNKTLPTDSEPLHQHTHCINKLTLAIFLSWSNQNVVF